MQLQCKLRFKKTGFLNRLNKATAETNRRHTDQKLTRFNMGLNSHSTPACDICYLLVIVLIGTVAYSK